MDQQPLQQMIYSRCVHQQIWGHPKEVLWQMAIDRRPHGFSVNDAIPKELYNLNYVTIDMAIKHILTIGSGAP